MKGYMGKMLYVHLDDGSIETIELNNEENAKKWFGVDEPLKKFLGGYGLGARFLYRNMPPKTGAFDNKSIIGFLSGPLNNTRALFGGRYTVVCKSPVTGGWNDANSGGAFGSRIKKAGIDGVFVDGIAKKPVYLFINDGKAKILDADDIWGQTVTETEEKLYSKHGKNIGIAMVGPAGERTSDGRMGSLFAAIMNDGHRAAARGGLGAVMGSKYLKAVVVKGCKRARAAHPTKVLWHNIRSLLELLRIMAGARKVTKNKSASWHEIEEAKGTLYFSKYGTGGTYLFSVVTNDAGIKNFTANGPRVPEEKSATDGEASYDFNAAVALSSESLQKYKRKKYCCPQCAIACSNFIDVPTKEWGLVRTTRPEYETMGAFGSLLMNKNVGSVIKAGDLCNDYGLDTISAGGTIAWAMECYDKGLLSKDDLDGIELKWGDGEAIINILEKMCRNGKGAGEILAQGSRNASETFDRMKSEKLGRELKDEEKTSQCLAVASGIEIPQHDPRLIAGIGRTYLADPTPGRHVKASIGLFTTDSDFDPKSFPAGTGIEDMMAIVNTEIMNSCGACSFGFSFGNPDDVVLRNITAVTGNKYSRDDLLRLGIRIFTMRQLFNVREGILRENLTISRRVTKGGPPDEGVLKDIDLDFNVAVDSLYGTLNWTPQGIPEQWALKALGGFEDIITDENIYPGKDKAGIIPLSAKTPTGGKNASKLAYYAGRN